MRVVLSDRWKVSFDIFLSAAINNGPARVTPAQINFLRSLRYDESKPGNKKLGDLTVAEARRHITVLKSAQELMKKHNWSLRSSNAGVRTRLGEPHVTRAASNARRALTNGRVQ
jgi:hypothetical protein